MTVMTYRGQVRNGQIALDEPATLPEGAEVSVQLVQTVSNRSPSQIDRRQILQMSLEQRQRLLTQQAERLAGFYASDQDRTQWQGGCPTSINSLCASASFPMLKQEPSPGMTKPE